MVSLVTSTSSLEIGRTAQPEEQSAEKRYAVEQWKGGTVLSAFGGSIGLDVEPAERKQIESALRFIEPQTGWLEMKELDSSEHGGAIQRPTMWYRRRTTAGSSWFFRDDPLRPEDPNVGSSIGDLLDDLHLSIALHATQFTFMHAGVVGWKGRAIVVPGRSRTGKSSLIHALVAAGAHYLSDEYALVGPLGSITPYPRPIHLRSPTGRTFVDPAAIGEVGRAALPAGVIVFSQFIPDATFAPIRVAPAAAALELYNNTIVADARPLEATTAAAELARAAVAYRSDRPDAAMTASHVLALVDTLEDEGAAL